MSLSACTRTIRNVPGISSRLNGYIFPNRSTSRRPIATFFIQPEKGRPQTRSLDTFWNATSRRAATSVTSHSTASDPAEVEALRCLEQGTAKLEEGDVQAAKLLYQRSAEIKRNYVWTFFFANHSITTDNFTGPGALEEFDEAITAWKESIVLQPTSPDAHTNLASAYIISPVSRPDLALHHLQIASSLSPEDPEIAFNLAAVCEATGRLEDALAHYQRSKNFGVERASIHIRNVSAKILGQRMKDAEESDKSGI